MKSNALRLKLAYSLRKQSKVKKEKIWKDVSQKLLASRKNRMAVNIAEIARNTSEGSRVLIAGKVLGGGEMGHKVTVAAFSFSGSAREKIISSGGKCMSLQEFMEAKTGSKGVVVLG